MLLTLIIAIIGALLFTYVGVPIGAMFGALVALVVAGKLGVTLSVPRATITVAQLILGMTVGAAVPASEFTSGFPLLFFAGLVLCMAAQVFVSYQWLHKREQWTRFESLIGSFPGALGAVVALNESHETPSRKVIFTHSVRLVFLVIASALIVSTENPPVPGTTISPQTLWLIVPLVSAYLSGMFLEKLGTPAPFMVTGMVAIIIASVSFPAMSFTMPAELVFIATAGLGAMLGIRMKDITAKEIVSYARAGTIATTLSLLVTIVFAYGFSLLTGKEFVVLLLSWVPGSIESMTLVAIYLGLEPALVMLSHITRMLILYALPLGFSAFKFVQRKHRDDGV